METILVNIQEAKTQLLQLGKDAWDGKTVVITKLGKPYLDLTPHKEQMRARRPGRLKEKIKISGEFNETHQDIIDSFEGA